MLKKMNIAKGEKIMTIKKGDVVQVNEKSENLCGCLLIVNQVKGNVACCGMKVPYNGTTYLRIDMDHLERIGIAAFVEKDV